MYSSVVCLLLSTPRRAVMTVVLWLLLAGVLSQVAPTLASVEDNSTANLPAASSDSMKARALTRDAFPDDTALPAIIVVKTAEGTRDVDAIVERISSELSATSAPRNVLRVLSTSTLPAKDSRALVSADGTAQLIVVPVEGDPSTDSFRQTVDDVRTVAAAAADGAQVAVTGPAGISTDTAKVFGSGNKTLLLGTILLVLVILLLIYRSPVMALIPVVAAGVAMRVAESTGALLADAGWMTINSQAASIMTVLLFGVGTDYALLITARYREASATEADRFSAMGTAMRGVGESILSSASTIILAMLGLLVAISPSLRGFGPYLALGVLAMTAVAFTFIPALTLIFGRRVFWPRRRARQDQGSKIWRRVAHLVTTTPRLVASGVLAVLFVLSLGLLSYQQSFDFVSGFRVDTDSARGQTLVRDSFSPGEIAPASIVVRAESGLSSGSTVTRLARTFEQLDHVARVGTSPRISDDGRTAVFQVALDQDPYDAEALDAVAPLQEAAHAATVDEGLANPTVLVGGETAQTADTRSALNRDTALIIGLVLLIVATVLGLLLRSVLAPVYLVGTLLLSFVATLGATTFFTLTVLGDEGIGNRVTAYIFIFLTSLGVDYNIFIMSRFSQEVLGAPLTQALHTAVVRTGGVVSSAGLILAATFSILMTQPIRELFQFGFAMAFGILLDTFLIRPFLVPAIVRMLGARALWPTRLPRDIPHPEPVGGSGP